MRDWTVLQRKLIRINSTWRANLRLLAVNFGQTRLFILIGFSLDSDKHDVATKFTENLYWVEYILVYLFELEFPAKMKNIPSG